MSFSTLPQLKGRIVSIYASHKGSCTPKPLGKARSRPITVFRDKGRKNWTKEGMKKAIKCNTMSVRDATDKLLSNILTLYTTTQTHKLSKYLQGQVHLPILMMRKNW